MRKLSKNAAAVLYCLHGRKTPSVRQIAEALNISRSTVFRALKELEAAGLLTRENRRRNHGGQTSNLYRTGDDKHV